MNTAVVCPACHAKLSLPVGAAGKAGRCPKCHEEFTAPAAGVRSPISVPFEKSQAQPPATGSSAKNGRLSVKYRGVIVALLVMASVAAGWFYYTKRLEANRANEAKAQECLKCLRVRIDAKLIGSFTRSIAKGTSGAAGIPPPGVQQYQLRAEGLELEADSLSQTYRDKWGERAEAGGPLASEHLTLLDVYTRECKDAGDKLIAAYNNDIGQRLEALSATVEAAHPRVPAQTPEFDRSTVQGEREYEEWVLRSGVRHGKAEADRKLKIAEGYLARMIPLVDERSTFYLGQYDSLIAQARLAAKLP